MDFSEKISKIKIHNRLLFEELDEFSPALSSFVLQKMMAQDFLQGRQLISVESKYIKIFNLKIPKLTALAIFFDLTVRILLSKRAHTNNLTLIYGLTEEQIKASGSLISLQNFFNEKIGKSEIKVLKNNDNIHLVQSKKFYRHQNSANIKAVPYISSWILSNSKLSHKKVVKRSFQVISKFYSLMNRYDILEIVGLENLLDVIVIDMQILNRNSILTTTQTQLLNQPVLFHHNQNKRIMFWYSENSRPIHNNNTDYSKNYNSCQQDFISVSQIDEHFVWTKEFANYLSTKYRANAIPKGPIMFYSHLEDIKTELKQALIFDITPTGKSNQHDFYNTKMMSNFVSEVVHKLSSKNYFDKIVLKPKRHYSKIHSEKYIQFLKELAKNKIIEIEKSERDIFTLISQSKLVVCIPFTSPALIAKELRVPVIYYYPGSRLFYEFKDELIPLILGSRELEKYLETYDSK